MCSPSTLQNRQEFYTRNNSHNSTIDVPNLYFLLTILLRLLRSRVRDCGFPVDEIYCDLERGRTFEFAHLLWMFDLMKLLIERKPLLEHGGGLFAFDCNINLFVINYAYRPFLATETRSFNFARNHLFKFKGTKYNVAQS